MKKITVKLIVLFISIMCISSILSIFTATFFTSSIKEEVKQNQAVIAATIIELGEKTELTIEEIVSITSTSMYAVRRIDIESLDISEDELNKIHNQEIVFLSHSNFHVRATVLLLGNSYIKISLHPNNTIFKMVASRVWYFTLSYISIGALLIILVGKRVVKPILNLNLATQEVAKGNFDIQLESKSEDEIGQLTKNFNKMARELKSIDYLRKDFITSVSHEFKTPLASIQGFARLLQKGNLSDDDKQEYSNIIVEETKRLSNLSSNILKLSKFETQVIVERRVKFSLDEQIRKSILLLEHEWDKKNIEFDIELQKVEYIGDEELLHQVWINLLENAIKFSNKDNKINIRIDKTESVLQVRISDYGIGMSGETMSRIFEKFYQGDKAHSHEGNGLGLPLVKRILELCGGNLYVESKLGEGSTFTVQLPI